MPFVDYKKKMDRDIEQFRASVQNAGDGLCTQQEIKELMEHIDEKNKKLKETTEELEKVLREIKSGSLEDPDIAKKVKEYGFPNQIEDNVLSITNATNTLLGFMDLLEVLYNPSVEKRNFDKNRCFSNIRWLLKQKPEVKIGQIEKEAGIRLGYMSRLEKEGNTSEPSIEFVVTAAKLLNVSIDTLISINLSDLTANEKYLVKVFDKLKKDTLADKLEWNTEKASNLNYIETDINGNVEHPLFELRTFFEKTEIEYPNQVTRVVFHSKSFEENTYINGDCYNLRLKNGTILYLMNICRNVSSKDEPEAYAIEAWTYVPNGACSPLLTSLDQSAIAPMVSALYEVVKNQMSHLRINKGAIPALDAFLKNDLEDDPVDLHDDGIPF